MHALMQVWNREQQAAFEAAWGVPAMADATGGVTRRTVLASAAGAGLFIAVGN